jgi:pimeloyl-ACP methyl ester carboxylesterase
MEKYPFVWAHGLCSSVAHEDELGLFPCSELAGAMPVARYDARGHGSSIGGYEERGYRWSAMVDDMLRAAEGAFVAGGIGMGVATALYAALRAPKRVAALVLVLPPAAWAGRAAATAAYEADADLVELSGPRRLAEAVRARPLAPLLAQVRPDTREVDARHLQAMDPKYLALALRAAARSDLPRPEEVRTVIVPTLILTWEDDPEHPVATARGLADTMLQADLRIATEPAEVKAWPATVEDFLEGAM